MIVPNDLVQVDTETALALFVKGYAHIPILIRDINSQDWSAMQPLYLDDLLEGVMFFASDSKRESLLNPPKTDIGKLAEEIALETANVPEIATESLEDDTDDDSDWYVETDDDPDWVEDEPEKAEEIPEEDESESLRYVEAGKAFAEGLNAGLTEASEVPTVSKVTEETDSTVKDEILKAATAIELGEKKPWAWNVKDAIRYNEKYKVPLGKLAIIYDISQPTLRKRIKEYKAKS